MPTAVRSSGAGGSARPAHGEQGWGSARPTNAALPVRPWHGPLGRSPSLSSSVQMMPVSCPSGQHVECV